MKTTGAITLDIRPSLLGQGIATLLAGIGLAVVFYVQPHIVAFIVTAVAIGLAWAWAIQRLNTPRWLKVVVSTHGDQITLIGRGKARKIGHIHGTGVSNGLVTAIDVRIEDQHQKVWVFADSSEGDGYKRLRARLAKLLNRENS